uniref:EF-hand domain-containing protein n=1 Tax=Alexandrium monilatum TaxID=311494 RepID=A0A7S4RYB2_9DINO
MAAAGDGDARDGAVDLGLLRASLLALLEERRAEAAAWLERHDDELRQAVERTLPGGAGVLAPTAALAPKAGADAAPPAARGATTGGNENESVVSALGRGAGGAGALAPVAALAPKAGAAAAPPAARGATAGGGGSEGKATVLGCGVGGGDRGKSSTTASSAVSDLGRGPDRFAAELLGEEASNRGVKAPLRLRARRLVGGAYFELAVSVLVVVYTVVMFAQLQIGGLQLDASLDLGGSADLRVADGVFGALALVSTTVFFLELLLRLYALRAEFFRSAFNVFDLFVVLVMTTEEYALALVQSSAPSVSFLRVMRVLRLARILHVVRTMRVFKQLRVLIRALVLSFLSVMWSAAVLLIFMVMGALFLVQMLRGYILDRGNDLEMRLWANRHYGTSLKALYTMFEITFSGCWPGYARRLMEEVSPWLSLFFVVYVIVVVFTVIRILFGLLLRDTMQAAASDAEQVVKDKALETKALVERLSDVFRAADTSGDGFLSQEEFNEILSYPKVQTWMSSLGVATDDREALFNAFANDEEVDAKISSSEFVNGIMRLRGASREQDVLYQMRDIRRILRHCEAFRTELANSQRLLSAKTVQAL